MKRIYISVNDNTYEELRKLAFDKRLMPGTLAARMVAAGVRVAMQPEPTPTPVAVRP